MGVTTGVLVTFADVVMGVTTGVLVTSAELVVCDTATVLAESSSKVVRSIVVSLIVESVEVSALPGHRLIVEIKRPSSLELLNLVETKDPLLYLRSPERSAVLLNKNACDLLRETRITAFISQTKCLN